MFMLRSLFVVGAGAFLVAACASEPADAPQAAAQGVQVAANDKNQKICQRVQLVGSRRTETICTSRAEQEALSRQSRDSLRDLNPDVIERPGPR
jgi:hypothetical protein